MHTVMRPKTLLRLAEMFYSLAAEKEKLPANSKDLKTILKNLEELETYQARKKYAEANLKHLSSGSSRIVYLTDAGTIVKLAKNDKGIAQNKVEANPKMKSKYLNKIISNAKNFDWIQTHFLEKIGVKEFEEMTDIPFEEFGEAIRYGLKGVSDSSSKKPKNFNEIAKTDFYKEMERVASKFKLLPGDIARISSWGTKDDLPILIDAGLTRDVYDDFYDSSSS